jgi:hypothetical protein
MNLAEASPIRGIERGSAKAALVVSLCRKRRRRDY